ncbi:MAG: FtsX-like permease family protein [Bacteroidota bacterium]
MNTLLKMAWRNIWRNKRRTFITTAAIAFAVFFASFQSSLQKGIWDSMIESSVNNFFGYAQIRGDGYTEEQTLDKAFLLDDQLLYLDRSVEEVEYTVPRLESFALASNEESTAGVMVIGVDPEREDEMTQLSAKLEEGRYLEKGETATIIAGGVAEKLGLALGDTLVIISQGYHGVNAAAKYPIVGFLHYGLPDLNKRMVYLPLAAAQQFYGAENRVTSLTMKIANRRDAPRAVLAINQQLPPEEYEVKSWEELIPELLEARQLDQAGNAFVMGLLYLIIIFGIFGTILMMTKEREYEFGVLTAIGMGRARLFGTVWLETVLLGVLGSVLGILLSIPLVHYLATNPIDMAVFGEEAVETYHKFGIEPVFQGAFEWSIFLRQALIIFIATSLLALYPLIKIIRLRPVEAMRA